MKSARKIIMLLSIMAVFVSAAAAQSLKGMGFNGATGLYNVPSGRIGWERSADLGMDLGYHGIVKNGMGNIPKINLSVLKWVELSAALDIQKRDYAIDSTMDGLLGLKVQLPITATAIALGGNIQFLDSRRTASNLAGQVYAALTYPGTFFTMPAETTMMIGTTFREGVNNPPIDFGMGFDLIFMPDVFQNFVHWIVDFSNFSYSVLPYSISANERGCLNTGLRIDLSMIPAFSRYKFVVDIIAADILDRNRSFAFGVVFGIPLL